MTTPRPHRRRRGWMSGMKDSRGRGKTPLWQWLVGIPVLVILLGAVGLFVYVSFVNPELSRGQRAVRTEVLERVETKGKDGALDMRNSWVRVRIEGTELKLLPLQPDFDAVRKGETIEVDVGRNPADGTVVAYSWRRLPRPGG